MVAARFRAPSRRDRGVRMTRVKVCGITRLADARLACELGASALGFVFWERSPRRTDPEAAAAITAALPAGPLPVGVFVDAPAEEICAVVERAGLGGVQLHGDETDELTRRLPAGLEVLKAVPLRSPADVEVALRLPEAITVLLDVHDPVRRGGTGRTVDWELAAAVARRRRAFLAGGLGPDNVAAAIEAVRPYAVDASSRLEAAPGVKDPDRLRAFLSAARAAESAANAGQEPI